MTYIDLVNHLRDNTQVSGDRIESLLEGMKLFVCGKSLRVAAEECGIPYETFRQYRASKWYGDTIELVRKYCQKELDRKFTKGITTAVDLIAKRIESGDKFVYQDGTVKYKPLTAYQMACIVSILYDKRQLLRGEPTDITKDTSVDERLEDLKHRFKTIQDKKTGLAVVK